MYISKLIDVVVYLFVYVGFLLVVSNFCYWTFNTKMLTSHFICLLCHHSVRSYLVIGCVLLLWK